MMRAWLLEAFNEPYQLRDIPKPSSPSGPDVLVQVLAASYCHTDAVLASGSRWPNLPRVGSHEVSGKIIALGPDVDPSRELRVGDCVGVPARAYHPCGKCFECRNTGGDPVGYSVYCPKATHFGLSHDGGFQEYALADSRQVVRIPSGLSAVDAAPLMCAGLTMWNALARVGISMEEGGGKGFKVAIMGAGGGLGHLGIQFASKLGCDVVAVDAATEGVRLAEEIASNIEHEDEKRGYGKITVVDARQASLDFAMKLLKNHSTVGVVSFPKNGFRVDAQNLIFRDIKLIGVLVARAWQVQDMVNFAAKHHIKPSCKTYPFEKVNDLVADYHKGVGGKLVVDMAL
ncbi:Alcohol dehydrogenase GroES-like domain-containing protein [Cladophialophora immunda]|nr:Alcohol dehydrogenase GroES-like domain-containing protein [Cladophialophora immunda]